LEDEKVTACLSRELAKRAGWNESPALYFLAEDDGGFWLPGFCVSPSFWQAGHPGAILANMARLLEGAAGAALDLFPPLPPGFAGVAFRFEGWSTPPLNEDSDPALVERMRRASAEHEIYLQPERVEIRAFAACATDGTSYFVSQQRGSDELEVSVNPEESGRIPVALARLTLGLKVVAEHQRNQVQ